jgi:hypothetical protein
MSWLDILVISGLGLAAGYPFLLSALRKLPALRPAAATKEAWQQQWTHTLIDLLADLDRDGMKQGASLCRELMWEILGGEGEKK